MRTNHTPSIEVTTTKLILDFNFFLFFISGELMFLNEATFLDNLRTRYFKDKIYVRIEKKNQLPNQLNESFNHILCRHT